MPTYRDTSSGRRESRAARLARAQSTASRARSGETRYSVSSSRRASVGEAPAAMARVGSFTGRTPVRAPQGGSRPSRAVPAS